MNLVPLAASALGMVGSWLTGGDDDTDKLKKEYEHQAKYGVGVGKLAAPGIGAVNSAYGDAARQAQVNAASTGLSGTSLQNVANADLGERRAGSMGQVYADATAQNEASKERARSSLLGLLGMRSGQQNAVQGALGSLTGAGIQGMLRGFMNPENAVDKVDIGEFNKDVLRSGNYKNFVFGRDF